MLYSIKLGDTVNIFILDLDQKKCAEYHNNRHCVKMIIEATQLCNTALILNNKNYDPLWKIAYPKHPCAIWTAKSKSNFEWLNTLGLELCREYTYRYGKKHKCEEMLLFFQSSDYKNAIPDIGETSFALAMPEKYRSDDAVSSYRLYYKNEKQHLAQWKNRPIPDWWERMPII
jgi:hypothetical protein